MSRGLTLLETLAAVTLLGLVAATAIPLTMRLGQAELDIGERLEARRWLSGQDDPGVAGLDLVQAVKGHPGWYLHRRGFVRTSAKPRDDAKAPPDHRWVHLMVRRGAQSDAEILADRVILAMDAQPAAAAQAPPP
jgi:hypothetical protein